MSQTKTARRKAAPKSGAAAARAELDPKQKTVNFRGVEITLPPELPKTFVWDLAAASSEGDLGYYRLAQSLIPAEHLQEVRALLADSDDSEEDFMMDLLNTMLEPYGLGSGKQSASPES